MSYSAFSPKQKRLLTWWVPGNPDSKREAIVCDGAVRSGKTLAMGLSFFLWACTCFQNQRFGVCGKTIASLRRNVLAEILEGAADGKPADGAVPGTGEPVLYLRRPG